MINFIICEDDTFFNQKYQNIIDKVCFQCNIKYKIHSFQDYNTSFFHIMKEKLSNKIYILDIEASSHKGTEIASKIRRIDTKSLIIFITSHYDDYSKNLLENNYMFFKYINKKEPYEKILFQTLLKIIHEIDKEHIITINTKDITYRIDIKDILYFYSKDRKIYIVTDLYEVPTCKSLKYYQTILPDYFIRSHKACLININQIKSIDKKKKVIIFNKKQLTNLLSKKYQKELLFKLENKHL